MTIPQGKRPSERGHADTFHAERDLKRLRRRRPDVGASIAWAYKIAGLRAPKAPKPPRPSPSQSS